MKKLLGVAVALALAGGVLYSATFAQAGFECEACVRFDGREACGAARAVSESDAMRTALSTACATLTSGVTSTLRCQANPPLSLTCNER